MLSIVGVLCFQPPCVSAEFILETSQLRPGAGGNVFAAEVRFIADKPAPGDTRPSASRGLTIPPEELARGEESDYYWLARAAAADAPKKPTLTSCLLATPGLYDTDLSKWKLSLVAETARERYPLDSRRWLELRSVRVGTVPAVQVVLDSAVLDFFATLPDVVLRIRLESPPVRPATVRMAPIGRCAETKRILQGAFLNGDLLREIPESVPASERRVRLSESPAMPPGAYRVSYAGGDALLALDLTQLGLPAGNPRGLRLVYHGDVISTGGLLADQRLWFYAPRTHTLTDRTDAVFATPDSIAPSPPMTQRNAFLSLTPQATEAAIERSRLYDYNLRYERAAVRPLGERFVFNRLSSNQQATYSLPVHDLMTTNVVQLRVELLGYNESPAASPDHFADLTLQTIALSRVSWKGRRVLQFYATVFLPTLPNPASLSLVHRVPAGSPFVSGTTDIQNLDIVELRWTGYPRIGTDGRCLVELEEDPEGLPRRVSIGGFPPTLTDSDFLVLDITNPRHPVRILEPAIFPDASGGRAIEFEVSGEAGRYFAQTLSSIASPTVVCLAESLPALPSADTLLEGIYVCQAALSAALAPLKSLRGAGIIELDPQAAYNVFNHGQESPEAIRQALSVLVANAQRRTTLPWVLLVGRGSLDRRNYLGLADGPQVPPFIDPGVPTSGGFDIETTTDYPYCLLDGDDQIPDAMVGRIPANTPAELTVAVNRIIAHQGLAEALREKARWGVFVVDDEPEFLYEAPNWMAQWEATGKPLFPVLVDTGTTETAFIRQALEDPIGGAALVKYIGHGNTDRWAQERVMTNALVPTITTNSQWPVVAALTCLNGYYSFPGGAPCLAEAWLFAPIENGAVANIAPTAVDYFDVIRYFILEFMDLLARDLTSRPTRVGELFTRTQIAYATKFPQMILTSREYILFGDPATDLTLGPPPPARVRDWRMR